MDYETAVNRGEAFGCVVCQSREGCEYCIETEEDKKRQADYNRREEFEKVNKLCTVCNGSGYRSEYAGIARGVCFYCKNGWRAKTKTELKQKA